MKKTAYKSFGFLFLGLALIGIPLPVLPTTPFVILAAWCFAQSSERWHQWLHDSQLFGPMLRNWEEHRCISRGTKLTALVMMLAVGSLSIWLALDSYWPRLAAAGFILVGCITILGIKSCPKCKETARPGSE